MQLGLRESGSRVETSFNWNFSAGLELAVGVFPFHVQRVAATQESAK
jgi:hypothetical protein